jgi:hypothetical protein
MPIATLQIAYVTDAGDRSAPHLIDPNHPEFTLCGRKPLRLGRMIKSLQESDLVLAECCYIAGWKWPLFMPSGRQV